MKIRIGKELHISWSILTQGENKPLEGRDLRLYLQDPNRRRRTLEFTTDANTILVVIPANTLTRIGRYALILTENEGQEGQTAVDANPAFTLVETTREEDTNTTEAPNLDVATINLTTGNLTLRMVIQELFEGKDGGDMKTGDILAVIRDGELHRVSAKIGTGTGTGADCSAEIEALTAKVEENAANIAGAAADASAALTAAQGAQAAATSASENAAQAKELATEVKTTAEQIQGTADSALSEATAARSDAENATTAANNAKSVADAAQAKNTEQDARLNTAEATINSEKAKFEALKVEFEKVKNSIGVNIFGTVRVSGVSDPQLTFRRYFAEGAEKNPLDVIHPCLIEVGTGKLLHILQNLNFEKDIHGNPRKIDGSEGEVYITNTEPIYHITGHVYVNNQCYDVFLRSLFPFTWQGKKAERIEPFGLSPDNCVAHKDSDNVTRMHSAYNPEWNGSYQAMNGLVGKFVYNGVGDEMTETYDENGAIFGGAGGLHTTNLPLYTGEQYAMNLNSDRTKSVPFYNEHAKALEVMLGHIIAEGGTFDAHNSALMGSGFCCNDSATVAERWEASDNFAVNGVRYLGGDGSTTRYVALSRSGFISASTYICIAQMLNDWRSPWRIMERQRVMFYAIQNNIPELTWFAFEGNKYKWRHVDGFAGPSEGALTCVVWKMFSSKFGAGTVDPTGGASLEGHRVDFLVCGAMYRGWNTDVSPARWTSGLIFTEDSNGLYKAYYQPVQSQLVISNESENTASSTTIPFETDYDLIGEIQGLLNGYRKDYNDHCIFLANDTESAIGAGLHTYIGAYNWFSGGKANAGTRSVRGFLRGGVAYYSVLSPFAMYGGGSPSGSGSIIGFGTCVQVDTVDALVE